MTDLRTQIYAGRTIKAGEVFVVNHTEEYEANPVIIATALHDITVDDIDKAQRIGELNKLHFVQMLERQSLVSLHPLLEMNFNQDEKSMDLSETKSRFSK